MRIAALFGVALGLELIEPPDGKHFLAAWLDTTDSSPQVLDGDRPRLFNQRMGFNTSSFQYGQNIPIDTFPFPYEQIYEMGTDTIIYLTIYPRPSPWTISDQDIQVLAEQCGRINRDGRRVLVRFAPEMNGNWNYWGMQPTRFLALWRRVHAAMKKEAPNTAMVWSPSSANGYPYGGRNLSAEDLLLLDTNGNGRLDAGDDPYSPFYPGDQYVDWVGTSVYHYGFRWPWLDNVLPRPGQFVEFMNSAGFYDTYAVQRNKPMMIAESGATFHVEQPAGPGELAIKQAWWRQYITNATFLQTYPKVKFISLFEFLKVEELTLRDFRMANTTYEAFREDMQAVRDFYLFANYTTPPTTTAVGSLPQPTMGSAPPASPNSASGSSYLFVLFISMLINKLL